MKLARLALLLATATGAFAQEHASDYGAWFLRTYGPAAPSDAPLVAKAEEVFAALAAVADQRAGRKPRLLVVDKREGLEAQALPDGTIVVNPALLRFCLAGPGLAPDHGRARLAFVLGHEMAHLANDDAWHALAFSALSRFGDPTLAEATTGWVQESTPERQAKELRADRTGFLYMLMAGYPPRGVLGPGGDFLTEWASRIDGGNGATDARHPAFRERSRVLRAQLTAIEQDLPFYRFGLRLSSLGRYDDAIRLLERFHSQFPSRETGANLGLAYYGRALGRLRDCGLRDGLRFRLATLVDPETLATRVRLRGDGSARCVASARDDLALAEQRLRDASEADPRHLPARLNLAVVLLAAGKGLEAYRVAAGTSDPPAGVHASLPDVRLATVAAVALHMAGRELPLDTTDAALEALREIDGRLGPRDLEQRAAIAFNRGRINQERGRNAAAREAWEALLALEPQGVWADEARLALLAAGVNPLVPDPGTVASLPRATLASRFSVSLQQRLARAKRRPFTLGDLKGCFVSGEDVAAMEIGGVLEIVEEGLRPPVDMAAVEREIGRPRIVVDALGGQQTRVYRDVAYDVVPAGGIIRVLFEPR